MTYEVIVQNVGVVYRGDHEAKAKILYDDYVRMSKLPHGRTSGAGVDLYVDGEPQDSYIPPECPTC